MIIIKRFIQNGDECTFSWKNTSTGTSYTVKDDIAATQKLRDALNDFIGHFPNTEPKSVVRGISIGYKDVEPVRVSFDAFHPEPFSEGDVSLKWAGEVGEDMDLSKVCAAVKEQLADMGMISPEDVQ